jgi:ribosomal-protein-alanine N-acetyltransferase
MVAEYEDRVVGYMIYGLHKNRIHLLNLAVAASYRRMGIASQMIAKLLGKLSPQRRHKIVAEVRETNLAAQLFLKECGFVATGVIHDYYSDVSEDAYRMICRLPR